MANNDNRSFRWAFDCSEWKPTREQLASALARIQGEERSRALSFAFKKDVKPAVIGRLMLRTAAAIISGQANKAIHLSRTEKGKPFVQIPSLGDNLDMNVSHHGRFCVMACEASSKVGVDIMQVEFPRGRSLQEFFHLMRKQFSSNEWSFIGNASTDDPFTCLDRFMRLWSLKEAYVKAEGFGISTDLKLIDFRCSSESVCDSVICDTKLFIENRLMDEWTFHESRLPHNHHVTVAIRKNHPSQPSPPPLMAFQQLQFEFFLNQLEPLIDISHPDIDDFCSNFISKLESPGALNDD